MLKVSKKYLFKKLQLDLVKHKCRYYIYADPTISDYAYDKLERKYIAQAKLLGQKNRLIVGFPTGRPKTFLYKLALMEVALERVKQLHLIFGENNAKK